MSARLADVIEVLEHAYPPALAEEWIRSGWSAATPPSSSSR